jgi:carboxypeptidase C (cathepsin A)
MPLGKGGSSLTCLLCHLDANFLFSSWVGNRRFVESLDWTGHDAFAEARTRDWTVAGMNQPGQGEKKVAGHIKSANSLTFLAVEDAGHMVPFDQPKAALAMLQAWLKKELV